MENPFRSSARPPSNANYSPACGWAEVIDCGPLPASAVTFCSDGDVGIRGGLEDLYFAWYLARIFARSLMCFRMYF